MKLSLQSIQRFLVYCFVFFGPLGSLLSPAFMPKAFRFYHLFLIFSPLFFIRIKAYQWKATLSFIPFLSYCFVSAYFTENKPLIEEGAHPFFRSGLLISQYLFMFGAAFCFPTLEQGRLLRLYLGGIFFSLIAGYILFFGYYGGWISWKTLNHFCVEAQMAWNVLRFAPGSYANEYGNVCSFVLAVLILLLAERKKFSLCLYLLFILTFIALVLTTTRAAYYSFAITFVYLCLVSKHVRRFSIKFIVLGSLLIGILKHYTFDFLYVLFGGIKAISLKTGSSGTRITEWVKGFEELGSAAVFGTGFGNNIASHNVYLELLYEVGIAGSLLLLICLVYYFSEHHLQIKRAFFSRAKSQEERLYTQITLIGLLHIFLFALTNHNMHHHLTWMTFLFFNLSLFREKALSPEALKDGALRHDDTPQHALRFLQ